MATYKNCQFVDATCKDTRGCVCVKLESLTESVAFSSNHSIVEHELIQNRCVNKLNLAGYICGHHRFSLGRYWKPSKLCAYPDHPLKSKAKARNISYNTYLAIKAKFTSFVLGALVCRTCESKALTNESRLSDDQIQGTSTDVDYIPDAPAIMEEDNEKRRSKLNALAVSLGIDLIPRLIHKNVDDLSKSSMYSLSNSLKKLQKGLIDTFCDLVAGEQAEKLKTLVSKDTYEPKEPKQDVMHLVESFKACVIRQARLAILTLVPKQEYSKEEVTRLFGCSLREVCNARKILKEFGPCALQPKVERKCFRLSTDKAKHFIDYLFHSGMLQEVAYGTTKLKLSSGQKIEVSTTILNALQYRAVREYILYCNEIEFPHLGLTTLRDILIKMKPKIRKRLAGIDNFVVEGSEAFQLLKDCCNLLSRCDQDIITAKLKQAKSYLKARFKSHCSVDNTCKSHCISHALSHPDDSELSEKCNVKHDAICKDCWNVFDAMHMLKGKIALLDDCHEKLVALNDADLAISKIIEWQRHIIRGLQQSKARDAAFKELSASCVLWIRDWAQKINAIKALESMSEYFGKRGMSLSVEVFIMKYQETYFKFVYLVALDQCRQDFVDSLSVAELVLSEFHRDHPHVKEIFLKTDNAGCYHANGVGDCIYQMAQKNHVSVTAYDFNEAQLGKDQADRETAIIKRKIESEIIKGENMKITNARELMNVVLSKDGPRNTKMCVANIDKSSAALSGVQKVSNISNYHSIRFSPEGITYNEFFKIGTGKTVQHNETSFISGAVIVENWRESDRQGKNMTPDSRDRARHKSLRCEVDTCICTFESENDLINHLSQRKHVYPKNVNPMDAILLSYANIKNSQVVAGIPETSGFESCAETNVSDEFMNLYKIGWARKRRAVVRFSAKQKEFLQLKFNEGEISNKKNSPEQVANMMRQYKIGSMYYFEPKEYLLPSQIRGFFTRMKAGKTSASPQNQQARLDDALHTEELIEFLVDVTHAQNYYDE